MDNSPDPAAALDAKLTELEMYWLELRCCKTTLSPLRLLIQRYGGELRLRDVLARLRCECCRSRPATVALLETALTDGMGNLRGWRVEFVRSGGAAQT